MLSPLSDLLHPLPDQLTGKCVPALQGATGNRSIIVIYIAKYSFTAESLEAQLLAHEGRLLMSQLASTGLNPRSCDGGPMRNDRKPIIG